MMNSYWRKYLFFCFQTIFKHIGQSLDRTHLLNYPAIRIDHLKFDVSNDDEKIF